MDQTIKHSIRCTETTLRKNIAVRFSEIMFCAHCGMNLNVGDRIVKKYSLHTRFYHKNCAKELNII